jgi:beta-galactosidase
VDHRLARRSLLTLAAGLPLAPALALPRSAASQSATPTPATTPVAGIGELRTTLPLNAGWRFELDEDRSDEEALEASGDDWDEVSLPHTWNAEDAASLDAGGYERSVGWYRLEFPTPDEGARHWLEIGAASLIADVWLNGEHLGQHKGAFTAFRFDVTEELNDDGENVLLIKADNREPAAEDDPTAIAPLGGDFNVAGGLYRYVALVSTADRVHFALGDLGGPGVYATTTSIEGGNASVNVRAKVVSDGAEAGEYVVCVGLLDDAGRTVGSAEQPIRLEPGQADEVELDVSVAGARLWQGREDPYLYALLAEIARDGGEPVDRVVQRFGIRQMRFDPDAGFSLNGSEPMRLHGVAMHQDYLGKAWAQSEEDWDRSFDLIMEMGANAVRFGHYPFPKYAHDKADELGLVVWAEAALGLRTTVERCTDHDASEEFVENAKLQLEEMIRQHFNSASVATWSVGNETTAGQQYCDDPYDNVNPVLQTLHDLAKDVDPSRPTVYAEFGVPVERTGVSATEGITDLFATNRYILWYTPGLENLELILDGLHELTPEQPLAVSEYGGGGAVTHHTDNPLGGYPDIRSAPEGQVAYQPEEHQAWLHEQNYRVLAAQPYLWGTFVWNMFDFGSGHRREGGLGGVNTKGLVTFDREVRKDAFFFYKANWSEEPTTHIVGQLYTDRAYAVNDVTVYSNADAVELRVNENVVGTMTTDEADFGTFVFKDVRLDRGDNGVIAVGNHGGETVRDAVVWTFDNEGVNIAAGRVVTGLTTENGVRFGSDHYFTGGTFGAVSPEAAPTPNDLGGDDDPGDVADLGLYEYFRQGEFSYEIPLENRSYDVTLGFIEPDEPTEVGGRVFDVLANGEPIIENLDIREEAGFVGFFVTRTFTVDVSDERLALAFVPRQGDAIVSYITVNEA